MKFYEVVDDVEFPNRWFLGECYEPRDREIDLDVFMDGKPVEVSGPLAVRIQRDGEPLSFTFAAFDVPIIAEPLAAALQFFDGSYIQRTPVLLPKKTEYNYDIINVTHLEKCVDESSSNLTFWREEDGRPDKIGQYRMVIDLVLHGVREDIKDLLQSLGVTGVRFCEVQTT